MFPSSSMLWDDLFHCYCLTTMVAFDIPWDLLLLILFSRKQDINWPSKADTSKLNLCVSGCYCPYNISVITSVIVSPVIWWGLTHKEVVAITKSPQQLSPYHGHLQNSILNSRFKSFSELGRRLFIMNANHILMTCSHISFCLEWAVKGTIDLITLTSIGSLDISGRRSFQISRVFFFTLCFQHCLLTMS